MRSFVFILLVACGSSQTPDAGGEAFCESYEVNYVASCRATCDADLEPGDSAGMRKCEQTCQVDLSEDDTFRKECPDRAAKLGG
jgi:hypothetical protein